MTHYDKKTETWLIEELRNKERQLSIAYELMSCSDDAIVGKSLDGTIASWNRGAEKIYGYSAGEIIGRNMTVLSPPDRDDEVLRILEKINRGERVENFETVRVTKEGRQIHVSMSISPIIDTEGRITGVLTVARDFTERKRTEEALRFTQFAIDRTIDQAFWMTEDGHLFYVNDAACRTLGYSRDELLQMSVPDIGPTFPPEVFARHWRDLQENGSATFESFHRAKDGRVYPVEIRANYVVFDGREYNCAFATDITGRKRMEEELLLTKFCIDRASITICRTAPDGKILDVNRYMCESLGYTREELTSMTIFDVDPTLTRETWPEHRKKVQVTGTRTFETLHRRKDGTTFPVDVTVNYLTFAGKEIGISFVRDITERKRVEKELRYSARRETILNRIANVFLTVPDEEMYGDVLAIVFGAMESKFGFFGFIAENGDLVIPSMTRGVWHECQVSDKSIIFPPDTWGDSLWGKAIREKKSYFSDGAFHIPEDHIPIDNFLITPIIFGNRTIGVIAVANRKGGYSAEDKNLIESIAYNVSPILNARLQRDRLEQERKRMEEELRLAHDELERRVVERTEQLEKTAEALRTSEERYILAVHGVNDGIWDFDFTAGQIYFSSRWKSILGYEHFEIQNDIEEWKNRVHPDDYQRVMEAVEIYKEGREPSFEIEYRLRHKDGDYRAVLTRGACLRDSQGRAYRMAGSMTDITERKKLELQLLQSQKMESVGILAGGVAHEFNNLLTAISGYGQILQESIPEDDELSRESIANVMKASERAADLTRGLLAFSRKQVISPKPVHIDSLITNTVKIIQKVIGEDIDFRTDFSGKNLVVKADPGQIEQVLMNMTTNARDAMPHGGRLTVTTRQVVVKKGLEAQYDLPEPGQYVMISTTDTGTGIDENRLESIFEPFYTTKEVGKGTGLGLSIVHGIIKQHDGSILVSSERGRGTTFDIYLPLLEGHTASEESEISAPPVNGEETLLIAEDEEIVKMYLKRILERAGYKVILTDNGDDAVARFRENDDISLVLSDVVMPGKSGREMLDEIRKMKPGIKVVFISGYAAHTMSEKGIIEQGVEFIMKPFQKNDLLKKIREVLDRE